MGLIKEPKGIDFIIQSKPLSEKEKETLSNFIQEYKTKNKAKTSSKKQARKRKTAKKKVT